MRTRALLLTFSALAFAACGGDDTTVATTDTPAASAAPADEAPAEAPALPYDGPPAEITITPLGNEMKYAETEFTVAPGQTVNLTLNNTATNPAMQHNVVVLEQGTDPNRFGQAAMVAADNGYIPRNMADQIVANTPMSQPGQTVEVTFTAPPTPGAYTYLCTFPGHYMTMRGVMRVEAQPA